jgi:hypothetical protein
LKLWWHLGARFLAKNLLPSNPTGVGILQGKPMPQHVPPITHTTIIAINIENYLKKESGDERT